MPNLGSNFYPKLVRISSELGMKPEDLLTVMISESGLNPSAVEATYNGGGLLGFMPDTLRGLKFHGSPEDFRSLNGEQQLDWVKKLVQGYMSGNGGKPFKSAAQYYMANFVPAALHLPGIIAEDPGYAFLEYSPRGVRGKDGVVYSKKYWDIGVHLPAKQERLFYEANKPFHGSKPGAITYGAMLKKVRDTQHSGAYRDAISEMHRRTGYEAKVPPPEHQNAQVAEQPAQLEADKHDVGYFGKLTNWLTGFAFAANQPTNYLVSVGSSADQTATIEYARILAAAIDDYLGPCQICVGPDAVDIQAELRGDKKVVVLALSQLSKAVGSAFVDATKPISSIQTWALVNADSRSDHPLLPPKLADLHSRLFRIKFASQP